MGYYRATADNRDRAKAITAVAVVHAALAAAILTGLDVEIAGIEVNPLKTFTIPEEEPPPPVEQPPPVPDEASAAKDEAAPANIRSKPTPVVAPTPPIPLPVEQKIRTAEVRGPEGLDRTAGASNVPGRGTGAGGTGSGFGGGGRGGSGAGDGRGYTPAQRISRIPNREYRRLVALSGRRTGTVGITIKVNTDGRPSHCRVARTSGDPSVDAFMCQLAIQHVRFRPARDPQGYPVAQDITWYPDWTPN